MPRNTGPHALEILAEVRQVRTMADGSVNVTLNLPEYCLPQAQVLLAWVRGEVRAVVEIVDQEVTDGSS